ncbi:MAG TPA: hypothetical protein VFY21_08455, partial [Xanthobacteraceae bacterium]|nr:hypothetical protein [Xanthobacteraceae bacterium]
TALIRESKADDLIKELAIEGMPIDSRPSAQPFWIQYQNLLQGIEGSEPTIGFDALVNCINQMANGAYKNFCDQSKELASAAGISDVRSHRTLGWIWQQWAEQHDGLIIEHKKLRQNPRLGRKVYRPNKPANWGDRALTGDDKWGGRRSE